MRVFNFSAGPAVLPEPVLRQAAAEHDAVGPLSEPVLLQLRYGGDTRARHLRLTASG